MKIFSKYFLICSILQIQGQIHLRVGSLLLSVDGKYEFLQIYFLKNSKAGVNQRYAINRVTRREIIMQLQQLLHEHNQLIQLFKTLLEIMPSDDHKIVIRADKRLAGEYERRFNAPMLNKVAIVVVGENMKSCNIVI